MEAHVTTPLLPDVFGLGPFTWNARDEAGCEWIVTNDEDWWKGPGRDLKHVKRPFADGATRTRPWANSRSLTFEGCLLAPTRELRDQRASELAALLFDGELITLTGPAPDGQYSLLVEWADAPTPVNLNSREFKWQVTLLAPDPVKLSAVEHATGLLPLPITTGGLTWPVTWPISWPSTTVTGTAMLTNSGSVDTGLIVRIDGPVASPRFSLARGTDVQTLTFNLTLDSGQWLTIDTKAHTVLLNDTVSRRGQTAGDFPILAPGTSELSWNAASYDAAARISATWRDARY
jgi:Phage tail protein